MIVAVSYVLLTGVFWGTYVLDRGVHTETVWIELSQDRPWWKGFLYPYDATRRLMSVPYHVAYLLSDGSYLSLHVLFGFFVYLTGLLTYLLVRRLVPQAEFVAFLAGAIALTHGADMSTNVVSMIVVRQAVVATLLAAWLLRIGWERGRWWTVPMLGAAQALSLWTYEPGLLMLLLGPLLIWRPGVSWRRFAGWSAAWFALPAFNIATLAYRYIGADEVSYQSAKLGNQFDISVRGANLGRLVYGGLAFWTWPTDWWNTVFDGCAGDVSARIGVPLMLGVAGFIASALTLRRRLAAGRVSWGLLALGAGLFLVAAYVPFLALRTVGSVVHGINWRTQFYAAPASGLLIALAVGWLDARVRAQRWLATGLATLIVGTGLAVGLMSQLEMSHRWTIYRQVVKSIVDVAPRIKDDTFIALVSVPTRVSRAVCDPALPVDLFEDTMWFNSALQVVYPRTRLLGLYWRRDGVSPGSILFKFDERGASLEKTTMQVEGTAFGYGQMIAFRYDPRTGSTLLRQFPADEIPGAVARPEYRPEARILPGPPPIETVRKLAR